MQLGQHNIIHMTSSSTLSSLRLSTIIVMQQRQQTNLQNNYQFANSRQQGRKIVHVVAQENNFSKYVHTSLKLTMGVTFYVFVNQD